MSGGLKLNTLFLHIQQIILTKVFLKSYPSRLVSYLVSKIWKDDPVNCRRNRVNRLSIRWCFDLGTLFDVDILLLLIYQK